jgi:hypothetical protein
MISGLILLFTLFIQVFGQQHASSCYKPESYSRYADKGAISILPESNMICSKNGLLMDLCEEMEIKLIELRSYPQIKYNSTVSITFYNEDESEFVSYEAETTTLVKGPSQFFHVPEDSLMSKVKKINIILPDEFCGRTLENDQEETLFFAFIGRLTQDDDPDYTPVINTDKEFAENEIDKACNTEVDSLPLNFLVPAEVRNSLYIDIQNIHTRKEDYMTKMGMGIKLFLKQKGQKDIDNECRGFLYTMAFNKCDIARAKYADYDNRFEAEFKPLPGYMTDLIKKLDPETLPKSLTTCIRDLKVVNSSED